MILTEARDGRRRDAAGLAASSGGGNRPCAHGWFDAGVGVGEGGPEEAPGAGVKRLRKLAEVVARRSSGFVVAQGTLRGGARRAALGFDAEGMWRDVTLGRGRGSYLTGGGS